MRIEEGRFGKVCAHLGLCASFICPLLDFQLHRRFAQCDHFVQCIGRLHVSHINAVDSSRQGFPGRWCIAHDRCLHHFQSPEAHQLYPLIKVPTDVAVFLARRQTKITIGRRCPRIEQIYVGQTAEARHAYRPIEPLVLVERLVVHRGQQFGIGRSAVRESDAKTPFLPVARAETVTEGLPAKLQITFLFGRGYGQTLFIDRTFFHHQTLYQHALGILRTVLQAEGQQRIIQYEVLALQMLTGGEHIIK